MKTAEEWYKELPRAEDGCPSDVEHIADIQADARADLLTQLEEAHRELAEFHAAMERERKPNWEKWLMSLADRLENPNSDRTLFVDDCRHAARQLRYMATDFTLKANFVPAELKLEEAQKQLAQLREALIQSNQFTTSAGHKCESCFALWDSHDPSCIVGKALSLTPSPDFIHKRELGNIIAAVRKAESECQAHTEAGRLFCLEALARLEQLTKQEPTQ